MTIRNIRHEYIGHYDDDCYIIEVYDEDNKDKLIKIDVMIKDKCIKSYMLG
jgi:hypothetical protein